MELWENNSLRQMKGKITNSKQQLHKKKKKQTHRQINKNKQKQQTRQTKNLAAKCKVLLLFYEHSPSIVLL